LCGDARSKGKKRGVEELHLNDAEGRVRST
jgi:hypothetical protein